MTTIRSVADRQAVFAGEGEMAERLRAFDWSSTSLGAVDNWSPSLRTMVRFLLANRFPLLLWWGPHLCQIYNDAYRPVLGAKHPRSIGQPARECWPEIWPIIEPLILTPYRGGPATWDDDLFVEINRRGFAEETHFTIAYSPVPDELAPGGIGGVLATVHEITQNVLQERRLAVLRDLGARSSEAKTAEEACVAAAEAFARHSKDVPFALIYLADDDQTFARLAGWSGVTRDSAISPSIVNLTADDSGSSWPLATVMRTEAPRVVELSSKGLATLRIGPWSDPPNQALVLPVQSPSRHRLAGFLVLGISARLELDDLYRGFAELATAQVASAIASARAYEEERQRAEALAEIDRAKTLFFSNVSHEFRTPLTLSLGPVDDALADHDNPLAAKQRERLRIVQRNHLRLLKLVNTLLDFSRIEAGRVQASYEPVDLATFTAELASVFRSAIERAGLRLTVDSQPLPEPVYVDRDMWEKIVLNLLSNAFKFTFEGEIRVGLRGRGTYAELEVRDTGVGIPRSELPRLFERFHRVEGTRARTHEGSGIGLALVQELAQLHGGAVQVTSEDGQGSTFTVTIPFGRSHLPPDRVGASRSLASTALSAAPFVEEALRWLPDEGPVGMPSTADRTRSDSVGGSLSADHRSGSLPSGRILVADDNADMRDYLRRLLGDQYTVDAVAHGRAALDAARAQLPDLVVADVMMPILDGFGLLEQLRADPRTRTVPVILLSARAGEEARVDGLRAGADDYLVKPFNARELLARTEGHLALSRMRRANEQALRDAQERLKIALAASRTGTFRWNPSTGEFLEFDENLKRLLGCSPDDPVRVTEDFVARIHPDDVPDVQAAFERSRSGADFDLEHRITLPDGTNRWLYDRARMEHADDGRPSYLIGACTDITGQVRARQDVEAAVRARDEFLSLAAHELRTPITSLRGNAQLALRRHAISGVLDPDQTLRTFRLLDRQAAKLVALVNQLLDVSLVDLGQPRLNRSLTNLCALVEEVVEEARARSTRHLIVARTDEPILAEVDRARLEQVLVNLIDNAIKYSPVGEEILVELVTPSDDTVAIRVRDHGFGISPEHRDRIFDRFYQAHRDAGFAGLGLGLYLSSLIVKLHGGTLRAEFPDDGGSRFVVELPRGAVSSG